MSDEGHGLQAVCRLGGPNVRYLPIMLNDVPTGGNELEYIKLGGRHVKGGGLKLLKGERTSSAR